MEVKCLEIHDAGTFMPVICIRPVPDNDNQRYLLRRDGYAGDESEHCIIYIEPQCNPYEWPHNPRTTRIAHLYIEKHWHELIDDDRHYKVGDILELCEYDDRKAQFTGRKLRKRITYKTEAGEMPPLHGLRRNFCILSLGAE